MPLCHQRTGCLFAPNRPQPPSLRLLVGRGGTPEYSKYLCVFLASLSRAANLGMALWGDGPRFEDAEDAKRAVEELVKERDELKHTKEALECLIKNQKSVLDELDVQVDAAQRRASSAADHAKIKMEDVRALDAKLATAKSRLQAVLGMFALENLSLIHI